MKLWQWFCKLGDKRTGYKIKKGRALQPVKEVSERVSKSGVDTVCSRVCGHENCQCGGTLKGLHCVWSYYRLDQ